MAVKRYWRLVGVSTPAGGDLELSELRLYEGGVAADSGATLTASIAPISGSMAALTDGLTTAVVKWAHADYSVSGFAIHWDFGIGGGVSSPLPILGSGSSENTWLIDATLQSSSDGRAWETFMGGVHGIAYPGANALTAPVSAVVTDAISYWPLDETTGSVVEDIVGANSGVATGATIVDGLVGKARAFDGSSQKINVPTSGFPTSSITLCFWANPRAAGYTATFSTNPDVTSNRLSIHLPWANATIYWDFGDLDGGGRLSTPFAPSWYNQMAFWEFSVVAGVGMKIYRNRVLLASSGESSTFNPTGKTFDIGYHSPNDAYWNGVLDEVILFGRALTSAESDALYNGGVGVSLVAPSIMPTSPTPVTATIVGTNTGVLLPPIELPDGAATGSRREYQFFDAYNGGVGTITGTVKEKNTPANTPLRRRVILIDEASRMTIRETWSDPETGAFEFRGIKQGVKYSTISYDHLHNYRAVIADNQDAS